MNDIIMNAFSRNFSDVLFLRFSHFTQYLEIKAYNENLYNMCLTETESMRLAFPELQDILPVPIKPEGGYFILNIPHKEDFLSITTVDDEITVGFSWYHIHFSSRETLAELYDDSIEFIHDLVNEKVIIFSEVKNNKDSCCGYIRPDEIDEFKNRLANENIDYIKLKSWNGKYNDVLIK